MVMNRYGTLPRFAGMGDGLVQTVARRYDYATLPAPTRSYVAEHAPLSKIFETMALTKDDIFVSGTEAAVRWRGVAILRSEPVELSFEGVSVFEIHEDGRIQSVRSYWDKGGLMSRLAGRSE